jgi:hypothetical protein
MTLDDMVAYMQGLATEFGPEHKCPEPHVILRTLKFIAAPDIQEAIRAAHEARKAKHDPAVKNLMETFPGQVILRHASE